MFNVQVIGEKVTKAILSAKKQPANNLLSQTYRSLGSSTERLKQRIEIKNMMDTRKNRRLELKVEHTKLQLAIELLNTE